MKIGRNDPCHCGSGKKYKQCHLAKDEAKGREARQSAEAAASVASAEAPAAAVRERPRHGSAQPWKGQANSRGFQRVTSMRKVGGS